MFADTSSQFLDFAYVLCELFSCSVAQRYLCSCSSLEDSPLTMANPKEGFPFLPGSLLELLVHSMGVHVAETSLQFYAYSLGYQSGFQWVSSVFQVEKLAHGPTKVLIFDALSSRCFALPSAMEAPARIAKGLDLLVESTKTRETMSQKKPKETARKLNESRSNGCGSKPMEAFWGRCTTHFSLF